MQAEALEAIPEQDITVMAMAATEAASEAVITAATEAGAGVAGVSAWAGDGRITAMAMVILMATVTDIPTVTLTATDMHIHPAIITIPTMTR